MRLAGILMLAGLLAVVLTLAAAKSPTAAGIGMALAGILIISGSCLLPAAPTGHQPIRRVW